MMNNPKIDFIVSLYGPARACAEKTGCSWELILAQAALETGWGQKVLPGTNNIFNIKADRAWKGPRKTFNVWEIISGKKVWMDQEFRVYPDYATALLDRVKFLKSNQRYTKAGLFDKGIMGTLEGEARALQRGKYATDPNYAATIIQVANGRTMRNAIAIAEAKQSA